jgi:hypothetical protein
VQKVPNQRLTKAGDASWKTRAGRRWQGRRELGKSELKKSEQGRKVPQGSSARPASRTEKFSRKTSKCVLDYSYGQSSKMINFSWGLHSHYTQSFSNEIFKISIFIMRIEMQAQAQFGGAAAFEDTGIHDFEPEMASK